MENSPDLKKTIADVRALNREKGFYFFSRDNMRFWHSEIHGKLIQGKYFITSEDNFNRTARLFTVRMINWNTGSVGTVGEFQQFHTLESAEDSIKSNKRGK